VGLDIKEIDTQGCDRLVALMCPHRPLLGTDGTTSVGETCPAAKEAGRNKGAYTQTDGLIALRRSFLLRLPNIVEPLADQRSSWSAVDLPPVCEPTDMGSQST